MKKILLGLLSFILILISFRVVGNIFNNEEENSEIVTITTPSALPSETPVVPSFDTEIIEVDNSYAPIEVDNEIDFVKAWKVESKFGSCGTNEYTYDHILIENSNVGTEMKSNQMFVDLVPLVANNTYTIRFSVSCMVNRSLMFSVLDGDSMSVINETTFQIGPDEQVLEYSFTPSTTINNGRLNFYFGNDGVTDYHTITFKNIELINTTSNDNSVRVNHLGYAPNNQKRCVFTYQPGDFFKVVKNDTNEVVYVGAVKKEVRNELTGEMNYYGDFTNVMEPGIYHIEAAFIGRSPDFIIANGLYKDVFKDALRFMSIQRCGYVLNPELFNEYSHPSCHHGEGRYFDMPDQVADVSGGWHDAGDYGRYVQTGVKALNDLFIAYLNNPESFSDDMQIDESGNGIPDILDEAKVEVSWLMKMQSSWGEVYSKAVSAEIPGDIAPQDDKQQVNILTGETTATGDFVGAMALSSMIYQDIDPDFSKQCLEKAKLSWDYLRNDATSVVTQTNPPEINAGLYRDNNDNDERFYASIAMYLASDDTKYLDYAKEIFAKDNKCVLGTNYTNVGTYGAYLYLTSDVKKDSFYEDIKKVVLEEADKIVNVVKNDGYNTSVTSYSWGSNGDIVNNGIMLVMAYKISDNQEYQQMAVEQLNYLFGKNALDRTFVTGYGRNYPTEPHHRLTHVRNLSLKGALVGGCDGNREDNITNKIDPSVPSAKVYADNYLSFASNEVAIYWNSALINLIAMLGYN